MPALLLFVAGTACAVAGAALWSIPAALLTAAGFLLLLAVLVDLASRPPKPAEPVVEKHPAPQPIRPNEAV